MAGFEPVSRESLSCQFGSHICRPGHQAAQTPQHPLCSTTYNGLLTIAQVCAGVCVQDYPGSTIVTDSVTSDGLTKFIEARGGKHLRWVCDLQTVHTKAASSHVTTFPATLITHY